MSVVQLSGASRRPAAVAPASPRPRLRSIRGQKRSSISGLGFAAFVVFLLGGGMVGLLALNVQIQTTQLALNDAQSRSTALSLRVSDRQAQVYAKAGPGQLAAAASALGMVPDPNLVYIDLRTGKVIGDARPVTGNEIPALQVRPATSSARPVATVRVKSAVQPWFDLAKAARAATLPGTDGAPGGAAGGQTVPSGGSPSATTKP